jgi:hypothetical protein
MTSADGHVLPPDACADAAPIVGEKPFAYLGRPGAPGQAGPD